jgi:hypothetical protein
MEDIDVFIQWPFGHFSDHLVLFMAIYYVCLYELAINGKTME